MCRTLCILPCPYTDVQHSAIKEEVAAKLAEKERLLAQLAELKGQAVGAIDGRMSRLLYYMCCFHSSAILLTIVLSFFISICFCHVMHLDRL